MSSESDVKSDNWSFEKEVVFESGAAIKVSIGYTNVTPTDVIKVISGLGILADQMKVKVDSFRKSE
ncbi:hypothetical protein [Paenibacillus jilunlii]|uniref:Uncharacterized protein n=1 Tax=Paenibacillus jilunlii TaxID=682956 RepID=A0A1G9GQY3_9BACL|nr:hypothetical protein [Paenibacillus jilunlii]KWX73881.1 hypothetical protein AML91_16635 [Paenibacillus jilunlii]SDL03089.1 hypothetical protein SAMN05216191_101527 [Paenibacillus jilunlii]